MGERDEHVLESRVLGLDNQKQINPRTRDSNETFKLVIIDYGDFKESTPGAKNALGDLLHKKNQRNA